MIAIITHRIGKKMFHDTIRNGFNLQTASLKIVISESG